MTLAVSQLGPDFVVLRDKIAAAPGDGEIIMSVDGVANRWPVRLESCIVPRERKTQIRNSG